VLGNRLDNLVRLMVVPTSLDDSHLVWSVLDADLPITSAVSSVSDSCGPCDVNH
jgi:hypothetical protein